MSNEYKDWLWDRVQDLVLDANAADRITDVIKHNDTFILYGCKNDEPVKFIVYFDEALQMWNFEQRELDI